MRTVTELINLQQRCAIVTGGGGYIGLAICETLMELGANVAVLDINKTACEERCFELNQRNYNTAAIPMPVDLSDEKEISQSILNSIEKMGGLDILVHSAAFVGTTDYPGWAVPFEHQTVKAWDEAMRVNLTSAFVMVQVAKPFLQESERASIIFIGSIYGVVGPDNRLYEGTNMVTPAAYAASKGGLSQLSRYLGTILAPKIRVNTIISGGVWREQPESFHNRYKEKTPLRRMAVEEDIKGAVAYLASDLSAYVTGTNLVVDGGWTAL
jgi:NAD(P)-dependent dehydrogenase (short-subunit alcohol dehydrogenase family)